MPLSNQLKIRGSHNALLGFDNLLEWFTKLKKILTYVCQFIIKDMDEQPDDEVHRARSRSVQNAETSFLLELGYATLLAHGCVHQPRSSSDFIEI